MGLQYLPIESPSSLVDPVNILKNSQEIIKKIASENLKGGFYLNRSEILSSFERELLRLKWVGNTTRQLNPSKESSRLVGDCLVSIY